jgi:hypothetical protein
MAAVNPGGCPGCTFESAPGRVCHPTLGDCACDCHKACSGRDGKHLCYTAPSGKFCTYCGRELK